MTNKKVPCYECICLPVCRHKNYTHMVEECFLLLELLYKDKTADYNRRKPTFQNDLLKIANIINSTKWKTDTFPNGRVYIKEILSGTCKYPGSDVEGYIREENLS